MKNKTSLLLMELLIMLLVFALSAAICLQVFAKARAISTSAADLDSAVILAQNAAEVLKTTAGDIDAAQALAKAPYRLVLTEVSASVSGLQQMRIQVYLEEEILFSLDTGWLEEENL